MKGKTMKNLILVAFVLCLSFPAFAADTPRTPTTTPLRDDVVLFVWEGLDGDDTGVPVETSACRYLTAHVYSGTYGSSTVTVEGSNAPLSSTSEWVGLNDPQGTAFSKTADGLEAIQDRPKWFRPRTASGTSADIDVGVVCQK